jgi:hypothetical protein
MVRALVHKLRWPLLGAAGAALVLVTTTALAGSGVGDVFNLGANNTVNQQSQLTGTTGGNPQLRVENAATAAGSFGVLGKMSSAGAAPDSAGVRGINSASDADGFGVIGIHSGTGAAVAGQTANGTGVLGSHTSTSGTNPGVRGQTSSFDPGALGVLGFTLHGTGVQGETHSSDKVSAGVVGVDKTTGPSNAAGVRGESPNGIGLFGLGSLAMVGCTQKTNLCPDLFIDVARNQGGIGAAYESGGIGVLACAGPSACAAVEGPLPGGLAGEFRAAAGGEGVRAFGGASGGSFFASGSGTGVSGVNSDPAGLAGKFTGNVHVTGKVTRAYTSGTSTQATPLAYGVINSAGTFLSGTPNVSATFDSATKQFLITIAGESYDSAKFTTTVTPLTGTGPSFPTTATVTGGKLAVTFFNLSGTKVQKAFSFVTYKP